jgi:hypothetical protein
VSSSNRTCEFDDLQLAFSLPCSGGQVVGRNKRRLQNMRKLFFLVLLLSVPVLANDDEEAKIKAAVEDR